MECNRDDAIKAVQIAKRKFQERDFTGAKRFVLKAESLYPGLDGLPQMLATFDVYISSENEVCGEADWYGILGVNPWDNEDTLRKQYRKLALMLHPDKNTSIGADGAFRLVSEAWSILSDKSRRQAYNLKRNARVVPPRPQTSSTYPSGPSHGNGVHFRDSSSSNADAGTQNNNIGLNASSAPSPPPRNGTFWTICSTCRTHFEYLRQYLNHNLLCPTCRKVFVAVEKAPPQHVVNSSKFLPIQGAVSASSSAQGASAFHQVNREVRLPQAASMQERNRMKREMRDFAFEEENLLKRTKVDNFFTHGSRGSGENTNGTGRSFLSSVQRGLAFLEANNLLIEMARAMIRKKLEEWRSEAKAGKNGEHVKGRQGSSKVLIMDNKSRVKVGGSGAYEADKEDVSINVPDSDFHNFDLDRSEGSFDVDQVWAAYDDDDGMPRFYARIHKVISLNPFKIKLSWLNSKNNSEFGYSAWIASGFYKTCGDFKAGKQEISTKLNSFSHKVVWLESSTAMGTIRIVPRKGEAWALYRNWSCWWNERTPDDVIHQYDVVEILEDYNEERGIPVSPLIKVAGFRTVFCTCEDPKKVMCISKEEMRRFSHQVPTRLLTGEEAPNVRGGFRELDPAALPMELLQVIHEVEDKKGYVEDNGWANEVEPIPYLASRASEMSPRNHPIAEDGKARGEYCSGSA